MKRILSLACTLALVLTLLPTARAAEITAVEDAMYGFTFGGACDMKSYEGAAVTDSGDLCVWGWEDVLPNNMEATEDPVKVGSGFKKAGLGWAVKSDDSLWTWDGGSPIAKVTDNVISCAGNYILKTDGSLWEAADSGARQILTGVRACAAPYVLLENGDLCRYSQSVSTGGGEKIMSGVAAIEGAGQQFMAIRQDGGLYIWGRFGWDGLSDTYKETIEPENAVKLLDNAAGVESFSMLAVATDGSLYKIALNDDPHTRPVKVDSNVVAVQDEYYLKRDGSLWWTNRAEYNYEDGKFLSIKFMDGVKVPGGGSGTSEKPETPATPAEPETPATPSTPANSGVMTGSSSLSSLSRQEIIDLLKQNPATLPANVFDAQPSCSAPYAAGKVSDAALQAALNRLNALRRICGIPATTLSREWCETAQYGAVVMGALGTLSHSPSQPAGMEKSFYDRGRAAAGSSNLSAGTGLVSAVDNLMDDSDAGNIARVGHRRWQLSPALKQVGFGYADNGNGYGRFVCEKVFDQSSISAAHSVDYDSFGLPSAGYFPNDLSLLFSGSSPWSVELNPKVYAQPGGITVKISGGGRTWSLSGSYSPSDTGAYLGIIPADSWNYGGSHCIVFRPDGVTKYEGTYTVEIQGLKHRDGSNAPFLYSVEFFSTASSGSGATPANPGTNPDTAPGAGKTPFTDVAAGSYYEDAVKWAVDNGVTNGVTPTQFQPTAACTRGQVVTFLWRAKGSPEPDTRTNPFTDVSGSSPFYKAILWAAENGITTGTTATTFNPSGTCSSGHVVTFLWRANGKPAASGSSALAAAYPGQYYTDAVAWADGAGLLAGTGTAFQPGNRSPRADIVTYLYRDLAE